MKFSSWSDSGWKLYLAPDGRWCKRNWITRFRVLQMLTMTVGIIGFIILSSFECKLIWTWTRNSLAFISFTTLHHRATFLCLLNSFSIFMLPLDPFSIFLHFVQRDKIFTREIKSRLAFRRFPLPRQLPARNSTTVCGCDERPPCSQSYWLASPMQAIW